jgi:hypothetical protein
MKLIYPLLLLMSTTGTMFSQDEGELAVSIYGGLSIPMNSFSSSSMDDEAAGYALLGAGGGFEWKYRSSTNVSLLSSLLVLFNGFNEDVLQSQQDIGVDVEVGSYVTSWTMAGFGIGGEFSHSTQLYGIFQLGLLLSFVPDIKYISEGGTITQSTATGTALAGSLGIGMTINSINFGIRYLTSKPEYELTLSNSVNSSTITRKAELPASVLMLYVGITL